MRPASLGIVRYEPTVAYDEGRLSVGDGHILRWTMSGSPSGKPAILLHGGPGSGLNKNFERMFDPTRYRIIQFDQRNCGESTPNAANAEVDLSTNMTRTPDQGYRTASCQPWH